MPEKDSVSWWQTSSQEDSPAEAWKWQQNGMLVGRQGAPEEVARKAIQEDAKHLGWIPHSTAIRIVRPPREIEHIEYKEHTHETEL